ncbi:hypothetical protein CSB37_01140 [bacterium DOLZORAL124_38_8]|nr:MAG: hypothetical protein CSB37_01140 [bacterium DOLZORAL124_38_8]
MKLLKETFRIWWQKPADATQRDTHRSITYLELFYDLVYVAIIIQLSHLVAGHVSWNTIFSYLGVLSMILWAWFNGSLYYELHGNKDIKTRVFTFLQMISLVGMGIFIPTAFGEGYQGFALSYTIFLTILTFLWWRTGVHDVDHKPIAKPFVWLFCGTTLAYAISIFTPSDISYFLWFFSVLISLSWTLLIIAHPNKKVKKEQLEAVKHIGPSFVERFDLLTIIILGEGIISLIEGSTYIHQWTMGNILNIIGSFLLLAGLWWIFFDFIGGKIPQKNDIARATWVGLHFPLLASLGLINTGILNILEYAVDFSVSDKLLIILPLIIFLLSCVGLIRVIEIPNHMRSLYKKLNHFLYVPILCLLGIIFVPFEKTLTLCLTVGTLLFPIASTFLLWIRWKNENE